MSDTDMYAYIKKLVHSLLKSTRQKQQKAAEKAAQKSVEKAAQKLQKKGWDSKNRGRNLETMAERSSLMQIEIPSVATALS